MASPVDSNRVTSATTTAGTTHTVNLGSPAAGDLLCIWIRFAGAPGTVTWAGYTGLFVNTADASDDESRFYYRLATGAEGASVNLTTANSVKMAAITWIITGAADPGTQAPEVGTIAVGTVANPDPGIVTPTGGSKDYLFLECCGGDGELITYTSSTTPSAFSTATNANSGTGGAVATNCCIGGASLQLTASSCNPGPLSGSAAPSNGWTAFTIAIHPAEPVEMVPERKQARVYNPAVRQAALMGR